MYLKQRPLRRPAASFVWATDRDRSVFCGGVPKWLKGPDSKSGRSASPAQEFESLHLRHVGANVISFAPTFYKSQSALILLLLLSKPDPLRWAPVWCRSMGGYFSFLAETSVLTALYRINGICERQVPFVMGFVLCGPSTLRYFNGIAPASRKNGHILFIRIARGGWHGVK